MLLQIEHKYEGFPTRAWMVIPQYKMTSRRCVSARQIPQKNTCLLLQSITNDTLDPSRPLGYGIQIISKLLKHWFCSVSAPWSKKSCETLLKAIASICLVRPRDFFVFKNFVSLIEKKIFLCKKYFYATRELFFKSIPASNFGLWCVSLTVLKFMLNRLDL